MNNQITINFTNRTIEITRGFEKKAKLYDSDEYRNLLEVCEKHPDFKVVVKARGTSNKSRSKFNGLTYDFMEKYIEKHAETGETIEEYNSMREELACYHSAKAYSTIKKWFLDKFPEIAKYAA